MEEHSMTMEEKKDPAHARETQGDSDDSELALRRRERAQMLRERAAKWLADYRARLDARDKDVAR
jgi:transposase